MAKTLTQLLADTRQLINQPDSSNSQFTDAQLTIWLNDAYRQIVIALEVLPQTPNEYAVTGAEVTVDTPTMTINQAKLKNPDASGKYSLLRIINLDWLNETNPDYENKATGMPTHLVRVGRNTVRLYPPPKTSVTAQTTPLKTYGLELPTEISAAGDTPDLLPENLHQILPHWPAYRCFLTLGDTASATQQLTLFRGQLKDNKSISTKFSRQLTKWRWGVGA